MELLVRIVDKPCPQGYDEMKALKLTKRGDVIAIQENGFAWSERERKNPEWAIIRVSITRAEAQALLTPEATSDQKRHLRRKRGFMLDLDALGISSRSREVDGKTASSVRSAKILKTPLEDPKVVGESAREIG